MLRLRTVVYTPLEESHYFYPSKKDGAGDIPMADKWELLPEGAKVLAVHAALLPSGKVLYFGGSEHDEDASSVDATRLWNPVTHRVERVSSPSDQGNRPEDLF